MHYVVVSLEIKIEDEDQAIILLSSLPKSYEILVTTLLVRKMTLTVDKVSIALLETENIKEPISLSHGGDRVLTMKSYSDVVRASHGRGTLIERIIILNYAHEGCGMLLLS